MCSLFRESFIRVSTVVLVYCLPSLLTAPGRLDAFAPIDSTIEKKWPEADTIPKVRIKQ